MKRNVPCKPPNSNRLFVKVQFQHPLFNAQATRRFSFGQTHAAGKPPEYPCKWIFFFRGVQLSQSRIIWVYIGLYCGYSNNKPPMFDAVYHPFMVIRGMVYEIAIPTLYGHPKSHRWFGVWIFRFDNTEDFYWAKVGRLPAYRCGEWTPCYVHEKGGFWKSRGESCVQWFGGRDSEL